VLRLATIDEGIEYGGPGAQAFVDGLAEVSGRRPHVEVTTGYLDGSPDAESRLIEAIAAGAVDGGWPSTRAFANAGIIGLEAIEAPMLITSFRRPEGALQRTGRQHGPRAPRRERGRRGSASPCSTCAGRSPSMRRCSNQTTGRGSGSAPQLADSIGHDPRPRR
jgi:hypothetical protein